MISVYSVLFALVLFSEFSGRSVTVAMPAGKLDGKTDQESFSVLLGDGDMTDPALGPSLNRRSLILDNKLGDEDGNPRIIIVSDMGLKRHSVRGLNPAFARGLPLLTAQSSDHTSGEYGLKLDRRETDLDMLRCMIGRVYRPCWQS
ncbi:pro-MCH [Polymixia lowei]